MSALPLPVHEIALLLVLLFQLPMIPGKRGDNSPKPTLNPEERERICHNFTVGNRAKNEIFSPNYPHPYPGHSVCISIITAPYGHLIKIAFRDRFDLEGSPACDYDFLEVRDGPQGYSPLLARLCGKGFPNELTSQDRYLWLKFSSDDSIEGQGFQIVYTFIKLENITRPETEECFTTVSASTGGVISPSNVSQERQNFSLRWEVPIDCTWRIEVPSHMKMYLSFQSYKLAYPNNCEQNLVDVYGETLSEDHLIIRFCGTTAETQKSEGSVLHLRFFARHDSFERVHFIAVYTAFRESETCTDEEFYCDDGTCIDLRLKCNDYYNCKYRYDEEDCTIVKTKKMELKSNIITILVIFFVLLLAMCASIIVSCRAKLRERRQRLREYRLRKSRLSTIDHQREVAFEGTQDGIEEDPEGSTYIPYRSDGSPVQLSVNSLVKHHPYCQKHRRDSMSPPIPPPPPPPLHLKVHEWDHHMDDELGSRARGMGFRTFRSDQNEESIKADLELKSLESTPDIIVHR